jgi:TolB-like protein/DNA-binding winged helix-turn-helix (wHTH) protein
MVYRLGGCELDAARFELRCNGQTVPVEPQVLELLLYLVVHRDRAVTRTELFEQLWRGRVVSDSALNSRIKAARAALGDDGASQEQIRTLHRTGYRFVGPVEERDDTSAPMPPPATVEPPLATAAPSAPATAPSRHRFGLIGTAALGVTLAAGAFTLLPRDAPVASIADTAVAASMPAAAADARSLAVLPFANLSADEEQEYFADGIGVELLKVLSHLPDLRVTGRTSSLYFDGRNEPPAAIGRQLGVAHLLTGSVRKADERVRITVELVEARTGYQLWSESYEKELVDIFDVQDEIATRVATALQVKLGLGASAEPGMTRNVAAFDEFLRGYAAYGDRTAQSVVRAVEHMRRAIALDESFARAWAYLYCIYRDAAELLPQRHAEFDAKAIDALEQARRLAPDSPFVRVLEAREDARLGRRLEARARFDALPPGYWTADRYVTRDVFLGQFLIGTGQAKDAIEALERARAADPLSPVIALNLALAYATAGDTARALATSDFGIELEDLRVLMHGNAMLVALGTQDKAEIVRRVAALSAAGERAIGEDLLPLLDEPVAARAKLRRLAAEPVAPDYVRRVSIAYWAAYFDEDELALEQLAATAHGSLDPGLLWRPVLGDVRKLPGFKDLVRREGLVDYWERFGWPDLCQPTTAGDFECR